MTGLGGNDILRASSGNDRVVGGAGVDTQSGGSGSDVFAYAEVSESPDTARNSITDFGAGTSTTFVDRLDLSAIDADSLTPGDQAFSYMGNAPFSGTAGQLRISLGAGAAVVSGDIDGNMISDISIELLGHTSLGKFNATDFVP